MVEYNKDLLDKYEALVNDFDECLQESVLFSKAEKERKGWFE